MTGLPARQHHQSSASLTPLMRPYTPALQFKLDLSKDMYDRQFEDWLKAIRTGDESLIRSHFSDAAKTYAASWLITQASGAKPPGAS